MTLHTNGCAREPGVIFSRSKKGGRGKERAQRNKGSEQVRKREKMQMLKDQNPNRSGFWKAIMGIPSALYKGEQGSR